MTVTKSESQIPRFKSYQEEADFWDTHSPEDFPGEFVFDDSVTFAVPLEMVRLVGDRETFMDGLAGLSDEQRQAYALNLLGFKTSEVATILGVSAARCRKALQEARARVKAA